MLRDDLVNDATPEYIRTIEHQYALWLNEMTPAKREQQWQNERAAATWMPRHEPCIGSCCAKEIHEAPDA